jgi:hypothetical protein
MGKTAQPCAARIERIGRAGFWRFVTKYFNGSARLARGIRGAYYLEASREVSQSYSFSHNGKINQNLPHHQRGQWRAYSRVPRLSFIQRCQQGGWSLDWQNPIPY